MGRTSFRVSSYIFARSSCCTFVFSSEAMRVFAASSVRCMEVKVGASGSAERVHLA